MKIGLEKDDDEGKRDRGEKKIVLGKEERKQSRGR
jgi:hypothetical protein